MSQNLRCVLGIRLHLREWLAFLRLSDINSKRFPSEGEVGIGRRRPVSCSVLFLTFGVLCAMTAVGPCLAQEPEVVAAASPPAPSTQAVASVQGASFSAQLQDQDLVQGTFSMEVARLGTQPAPLDWTGVNVAMNQLRWGQQKEVIRGTTADQRSIVLTDFDSDTLTGKWSAHGQQINQTLIFDLTLPPALNTKMSLRLAENLTMTSSQGVLQAGTTLADGQREWMLELGNLTSTTLKIGPAQHLQQAAAPRYEIETEHRARRDGIFLKSDITIDGPIPDRMPLEIEVLPGLEIQSLTMFSGGAQVGIAIPFQRDPARPEILQIPTDRLKLESRFTLRLRAFQQVIWGEPHVLPRIFIQGAIQTRRTVVVRVELPLQLQSVEAPGMLQVSLSSDESAGEVWKYEAREPDSQLTVVIDLPRSEIVAELSCLADARPVIGWAAAVISMHVENGTRFSATIQLPEDWKLVSVAAGDAESRLSSWKQDRRQLDVTWQNPMTPTSHRQLRLFARTNGWKLQTPLRLQLPQIRQASDVAVQYQVLLPPATELQVLEGEGWRVSEGTPISPLLLRMREVTERVTDPSDVVSATLKSVNEIRPGRTLLNLMPKSLVGDPLVGPIPGDGSARPLEGTAGEATAGPPALEMQLQSMVGPAVQKGCLHHAELRFDRPVPGSSLNLRLPMDCKLSAVEIDGRSVTVFRKNDEIPLPSDLASVSSIGLTYITPQGTGWLYQSNTVPIPQTSVPVSGFNWTLDLPGDQRLARMNLPGLFSGSEHERTLSRQMFGPLTRSPSEKMFHPLQLSNWVGLLEKSGSDVGSESQRRSLKMIAPTVGDTVQFVTWDSAQTRHYAWVALLGCLMIGAAARLFQLAWLRQLTLVWLILIFAAAAVAPPAWTLILGGMFSGSLLSILLPRRWVQKRDFLSRTRRDRSPRHREVVTASIICLWTAWAWGQSPSPVEPAAKPATETIAKLPSTIPVWLLESARYELLRASPTPQIRAKFQVFVRASTEQALVRLPLRDVVFSSSAECLVNGETQTLIPSLSGDAMMVPLPRPPADAAAADVPVWSRTEIQVEFSLRPQIVAAAPMGTPMNATPAAAELPLAPVDSSIPVVLDSVLQLSAELAALRFQRWGDRTSASDGTQLLQLGGIGKLQLKPESTPPVDALGATAITMLDVTPLRFKGQTRLMPGSQGWPALLPLTFPAGTVISSVTGANVIDSIDSPRESESLTLTLRLRSGAPALPVAISFELPGRPLNNTELTIPAFPLWNMGSVMHTLGMTGPATSTLTLVKSPGVVPMAPEDWPAEGDMGRSRPAVAMVLTTPQPVQLSWNRLNPVRMLNLSELIEIRREELAWSATIRVGISQLPSFRHQFEIDPALRIESVSGLWDDMEHRLRYSRVGNVLSIFLPGGQLGERTFTIRGSQPMSVDTWSPLPTIRAMNTSAVESELTLVDRTGWTVELESAPGVPYVPPRPTTEAPSEAGGRLIGVLRPDTSPRTLRYRVVMPPGATRCDTVTYVHSANPEHWEVITTFHFTAQESALKKAVFRIPPELVGIRIRPSLFQYTSTTDTSGTTVQVKVPERYSNAATMTIAARLAPAVREQLLTDAESDRSRTLFPMIETLSAQKGAQLVLVDPRSPVLPAPTGSLRIDAAAFPAWAPAEWIAAVQKQTLTCYQLIRKELLFVKRTAADLAGHPVVHLDETVIWPVAEGQTRGLSRLWLASKGKSHFHIQHGAELEIIAVAASGGGTVITTTSESGTNLAFSDERGTLGAVIHWKLRNPRGEVQLLNFAGDAPQRRLVALVRPDHWHIDSGSAKPAQTLAVWLARWQALLECLPDVSGPIPMDSVLLNNIRLCQQESAAALRAGGNSGAAQAQQEFNRLTERWDELKGELVISGTAEIELPDPQANAFIDLLRQPAPGLGVEWILPEPTGWNGRYRLVPDQTDLRRVAWGSLLAVLAMIITWWCSPLLKRTREALANHPIWSFMLLGLVWWIWLSPSVVGLLMILGAWIWSGLRLIFGAVARWRQKWVRTA